MPMSSRIISVTVFMTADQSRFNRSAVSNVGDAALDVLLPCFIASVGFDCRLPFFVFRGGLPADFVEVIVVFVR